LDEEFRIIIIDALTEALQREIPVTIKNNVNSGIIVITAVKGKIILSLSKMPGLLDDIVHTISDALGAGPDLIYDRISVIKEDFVIYYVVWIRNNEESKGFVEQEFSMAQNHITFMSPKAISIIQDAQLKS
jgi:hypothetical protein